MVFTSDSETDLGSLDQIIICPEVDGGLKASPVLKFCEDSVKTVWRLWFGLDIFLLPWGLCSP